MLFEVMALFYLLKLLQFLDLYQMFGETYDEQVEAMSMEERVNLKTMMQSIGVNMSTSNTSLSAFSRRNTIF